MQIFRGEIKIQSRWKKIRIQSKWGKWSRGNFCYIQQWTRHQKCSRHLKKIFSKQSSAALLTLYQRTIFGMQTNEIKLSFDCTYNLHRSPISFFYQSKKKFPVQRQDPLRLPGWAQLPGHGVQVQGGGGDQRDDGQLLLPSRESIFISLIL